MEKLQKALQKAKEERRLATDQSDLASRGTPVPAGDPRRDARAAPTSWDDLPEFSPDEAHLWQNRVTTLDAQSPTNPFDMLRTKAYLMMRRNKWKRVAITSPTQGCGKTTTACNLAVGFARQPELKTMLFDTDMRKPAVHKMMGHTPKHSIDEMLRRKVSPAEQMVCLSGNVALSMANRSVNDPTALLLADTAIDMLQEIEDTYRPDVMIFDLPPMLGADDARVFLKNVDCALIVARAEYTKMSQLDRCEQDVAEYTNVLGISLNDCRLVDASEDSYGQY